MMALSSKLLGNVLLKKDGLLESTDVICNQSKVLGLYFASFTCSSCTAFVPELLRFYNSSKEADRGFEIIQISWDSDEKQFSEHLKICPWFFLPFNDNERKTSLSQMFHVKSVPSLVLINAKSCDLITTYGKAAISDDPKGIFFPWKIREAKEVLSDLCLLNSNNSKVDFINLPSCVKGLYFSAHWCPPCKAFTPHLIKLYKKLEKKGKKFEVIFVSSDLSAESFEMYYSTMPWLAVPYQEHHRRKELAQLYGVGGIPSLVILNEENNIVTKEGRMEVNDDPDGEDFPWKPKLVDELSEKHVSKLNEEPCLILFTVCEEKELDAAHYLLLPAAEEYKARVQRAKAEDTHIFPLNFFYAGDAKICDSVRNVVQVNNHTPLVVILDMTKNCKFVLENKKAITSEVISKFVRDFLTSKLTSSSVCL